MYSTYIMGMGILDFDSSLEEVLGLMSFQPQTLSDFLFRNNNGP